LIAEAARPGAPDPGTWEAAALVATLVAVDPAGAGGVALRAPPGPVREHWLAWLREALAPGAPFRRVPIHVGDDRLFGGLDLAATLATGRPVTGRGLLAEADGGILLLAMAERLSPAAAARLCPALDAGGEPARPGAPDAARSTRIGVVALDEGLGDDERIPPALAERLAFHLDLGGIPTRAPLGPPPDRDAVAAARVRLAAVSVPGELTEALCATALALGIDSLRAPVLALRVARAAAALAGAAAVSEADAALAARLVLAPRARAVPAPPAEDAEPRRDAPEPRSDASREDAAPERDEREPAPVDAALPERLLEAAAAALPPGLLERLAQGAPRLARTRASAPGAGARRRATRRGRPLGAAPGDPRSGARLDLVETLRAAAPWQRLRRAAAPDVPGAAAGAQPPRVAVRRADFRVRRFEERREATTIFAVDASGSTALQRLAEAKGAVELLLAACYARRDRVALVAFRGRGAELLLPPTRSLVRAKRELARLPGGGGTPLAAGVACAARTADTVVRQGGTPLVVFLTDGRANVALDGTGGRERADADARAAASALRAGGIRSLVVDTSPRPRDAAERFAASLGAAYLPLPHADSAALRDAVRGAHADGSQRAPRSA